MSSGNSLSLFPPEIVKKKKRKEKRLEIYW